MTREKFRDESINPTVDWLVSPAGLMADGSNRLGCSDLKRASISQANRESEHELTGETVMTRTLRTAMAFVLASLAVLPMSAESEPNLDGWYVAEGFDTDGTRYRALMVLRRDAQSYRVTMFMSQTSEATEPELAAIGVGLQNGSILAVNYNTPDHARLAVYRIEGGRLIGQWILVGGDGMAHAETLTRIAGAVATAHVPSPPPVSMKGGACSVPTVFGRGI